jgi:oligoribonuclease NrnB/cAMP/cGMP phosphodiesterase (DHH superfamily)
MLKEHDHLITHAGCMDGAGCSLVFQFCGGRAANIHYCSPSHERMDPLAVHVRNSMPPLGTLYIADISVSEEAAAKLDALHKNHAPVYLCDHHRSAIPLDRYGWCTVDKENKRCGSLVFYDHLKAHARPLPEKYGQLRPVLEAIDDRDRWINENPASVPVSELFNVLGQDLFVQRFLQNPDLKLSDTEDFMVRCEQLRKQQYIERLLSRTVVRQIGGYKVGFVNCEVRYTSEAGHFLCDKLQLQCCALINPDTVSLRAPESSPLDMSVIAKRYGGGGHKGAAGFQLKSLTDSTLIEIVAGRLKIHDTGTNHSG